MLRISTKVDYAIIMLRELALHAAAKTPVSLRSIARDNHLPYAYTMRIATDLRKSGLIDSFEGQNGGFVLVRKPKNISITHITNAVERKKKLVRCLNDHNRCTLRSHCSMTPHWLIIQSRLNRMLADITLADFI